MSLQKLIRQKPKTQSFRVANTLFTGIPIPAVMGIVNITQDSFFDGGEYYSFSKATSRALKLVQEGAKIIDVGGESSRPGASKISEEEELRRVIPIIEELQKHKKEKNFYISIETVKSEVAEQAVLAGADIINDISALSIDPNMATVIHKTKASCILNHLRGSFGKMQQDYTPYDDVFTDVSTELLAAANKLAILGVPKEKICLDPGIGFGKSLEDNLELISSAEKLSKMDYPTLWGLSRKSFIGKISTLKNSDRFIPSIVSAFLVALSGTNILRVHDVSATIEALHLLEALRTYDTF